MEISVNKVVVLPERDERVRSQTKLRSNLPSLDNWRELLQHF